MGGTSGIHQTVSREEEEEIFEDELGRLRYTTCCSGVCPGAGGSGEETGDNSGLRKEGGEAGKRVLRPEGCTLVIPGGAGPLTSSVPTVAMQDNGLYSALKGPEQHSELRKQGFA